MEQLEAQLRVAADFLWGNWLLFALVGLGVYYTAITGCVQLRRLPYIIKSLLSAKKDGEGRASTEYTISSLQSLCTAIASCVGSGNIVGVSTAILAGGPGALFWMWVAAFFGMATKFGEIVLGICYRDRDEKGMYFGAPMYYIAKGLRSPIMGGVVAVLLFLQNTGGTLIQSNTIVSVVRESFNIPPAVTGVVLAVLMFFVISGGLRRLVAVTGKIVPIMAGLYVAGGLIVIGANISALPDMLASIFTSAFTLEAGTGALVGITMREAMRFGVARGLYSNEAGEGSAAVLHSPANVDHPVRQGIYGVVEVFVDTIVICSTTGFVVLITGVNEAHTSAATLSATAFGTVMPLMQYVVSISLILFAATSLMSQWYFGHVSLKYLKIPKGAEIYRVIFPLAILAGSISSIELVWLIQDCALGLLIIPNMLALVVLSPKVRRLTEEFFSPANGYIKTLKTKGKTL